MIAHAHKRLNFFFPPGRDANCTDIALGPLALIPQCYRTPQGSVRLNINESDPDILDLCFYLSEDCNETSVDTCHVFVNGEPCDCPFFRGLNDSLYVVFEWDPATIELLIDIIDMFPHFRTPALSHNCGSSSLC